MDHKAHGARKILEIKNHNEISVNNITYKVDSLDCDINLLDWIRDNTPFKGTKEERRSISFNGLIDSKIFNIFG